ncbi:uncharacterized protein LOC117325949 isoform X2 [Pecten maximus]|uniref:uncharacterized protein LOC117325949 isoform X2 n=1 Tax=Pecten maximus TaxID=6579 RepID=UPI0014584D22|nr:uncharacterized protein LOC117325949 isoform X2 [Pecten maximus]
MNQPGPPLPPGWSHAFTPQGQIYFINHSDGTTSWHDPRISQGSILLGIIKKYNCATANDQQTDTQQEEWRDKKSECKEEGSLETLQSCVKAVQEQICVKGFPPRGSSGAKMAKNVNEMIVIVMRDCVDGKKVKVEDCQKMLFEFLLSLLATGPGTAAADIIQNCLIKTKELIIYLEEMRGKEFTRIIESLKLWTHTAEGPNMTLKDQSNQWESCITALIKRILGGDNKEARLKVNEPTIHQQFLELYLFYFKRMGNEPEDYSGHLRDFINMIQHAYKGTHEDNPYMPLKKQDVLQRHWKTVGAIICSDKFIFEKQVRKAPQIIKQMVVCILKKDWFGDLVDDVLDLFKKYCVTKSALQQNYKDVINGIRHLLDETPEEVYNKHPEIVDKLVPIVTELVQRDAENMAWAYGYLGVMKSRSTAKKGTEQAWLKLIKALAKSGTADGLSRCYHILDEGKFKKIWNWKQNFQQAVDLIKSANEILLYLTENKKTDEKVFDSWGRVIRSLLEQFKLVKIQQKIHGEVAVLAITMMEKKSKELNDFVEIFLGYITLVDNRDVIPGLIRRFSMLVFDIDYMWDHPDTKRCGRSFIQAVLNAYSTGQDIPDGVNKTFIRMFIWTMQTEGLDYMDLQNGTETFYCVVASRFLGDFASKHVDHHNAEVCKPLIPALFNQMEHEEKNLVDASRAVVGRIGTSAPNLLKGHLSSLVAWCKCTGSLNSFGAIYKPYEESDGFTKQEFKDIMEAIEGNAGGDFNLEPLLLKPMAVKQGELFTQHHVDFLISMIGKQYARYYMLQILGELIPKQPKLFGDSLIKHVLQNPEIEPLHSTGIQMIAVNLGLTNQSLVVRILKELIILVKKCPDHNFMFPLLDAMRTLAAKYGVETLKPHREFFEDLQQNGKTMFLKDTATSIVNAMDGISMQGIVIDVIQTKEKVEELDKKVTKVEGDVKGLKTTVDRHDKEITTVKTGIKTVKKRVDVVEKDLSDTKVKVEEIDKKTMSNAPAWSRDLTKLMNPKSDHDWRLLAQRLGYSPKDIKAWATQNDPCMALLSEWYATNKTSEATHAVLTTLQEMNRQDAAIIVENAMKVVDDVVKEAPEYTKPPPVFLSYQWGHQNEVKLLRQHLLMAGYECWMDIGQMGGGDKLFQKIDNGIRGSKVVICCVSGKYAKSPNCNREVNLAVNLGKPMIPLLMEKMGWPPQGSMGPIFSEYLFVRFFQREGEETKDQRYWPVPKFQELLMQLNIYKTLPDESLVAKEYKKWWVPVAEEIIITKKPIGSGGQNTATTAGGKGEESKSPDVFLSYQWGKQKQIKQLYKRLCELGLTCWMDIYQMGGGDSLYDKIDRGVRGCKIVLSCVTTKYAVSANCRREVSLADSLKKPVVPLLLEEMQWPPSGPMSMVFTQLLFINFYRDEDVQMTWKGDKFDELLSKVTDHVPGFMGCIDDSKTKKVKEIPEKKPESEKPARSPNAANNTVNSPPPPLHSSENPSTAQQTSQPPPPPYTPQPQSDQPQPGQPYIPAQQPTAVQPHTHGHPYAQQQQYGHAQPQAYAQQQPPYAQQQMYGQTPPQPYAQQQPYGHAQYQAYAQQQQQPYAQQQMHGQAQPYTQQTSSQASPAHIIRANEKSSSCVLL